MIRTRLFRPACGPLARAVLWLSVTFGAAGQAAGQAAVPPAVPAGTRGGGGTVAAEPVIVDLDLALRYALDRSWRMQRLRLDLRRDQYNLEASRAGLKSSARLNFTLPNYDQSIKEIIDPSTGNPKVLSTRGARYASSLTVQQPLPIDGTLSLTGQFTRTQDQLLSYTPGLRTYNAKLSVRYEQPLLQPNSIQMDIRRAELRLEQTRLSFTNSQIDVINDISRSFFDLYEGTYQAWLTDQEVARMERIYAVGRRRFQAGTVTEIDMLQLEVDLADRRDRASSAQRRLEQKESEFRQEIGLGLEDRVAVEIEPILVPAAIPFEEALPRAMEHRTEVRHFRIFLELEQMELRERRAGQAIKGTLALSLGIEGRGKETEELIDAFKPPDQARGAAFHLDVPLWDWGRNTARVNSKLTEIERMERTFEETQLSIERDVRTVAARVQEAEQRLTRLVRSVEQAERSFDLALAQYEQGSLGTLDLVLTQNRLAQARRSNLGAYLDYRRSLIDLMGRTYWDWERDQPLVQTLAALIEPFGT